MITTIIFDFDGVLMRALVGVEEYFRSNIDSHFKLDDFDGVELDRVYNGKMLEDEYWEAMINKYHWAASVSQIKEVIRQGFEEIPGTRTIIENLKHNGYRLGLLSVHGREWIEYCERKFNYHGLFDATLYSFEIGLSKPEKEVYKVILERLRAKPSECIFIDDNETYLEGARKLGIATIHFESAEQLKKQLENLGVNIN